MSLKLICVPVPMPTLLLAGSFYSKEALYHMAYMVSYNPKPKLLLCSKCLKYCEKCSTFHQNVVITWHWRLWQALGFFGCKGGVVKNCTGWGELTVVQSYDHSFSVYSLMWIIPSWSEGTLEKTGMNHPGKAWGRRNNWTLHSARGQALRFDSFHFTTAYILEVSLLSNFSV